MKYDPTKLRWEGNDQALRDFDAAVGTSTRPALITHLTGSSIGSPVGSFASGARIVVQRGTLYIENLALRGVDVLRKFGAPGRLALRSSMRRDELRCASRPLLFPGIQTHAHN